METVSKYPRIFLNFQTSEKKEKDNYGERYQVFPLIPLVCS